MFEVVRQGSAVVVYAADDLDLATAAALHTALREALSTDPSELTVDIAAVSFLDSTAISVFAQISRLCVGRSTPFSITNASPSALRIFEITHLDRVVRVSGT